MNLSHSTLQHFPAILIAQQARIRFALIVLLAIYLIAYAAEITWRLIPSSATNNNASATTSTPVTTHSSVANSQNGVDIEQIQRLNLFGELNKTETPKPVEQTITNAPQTRLKLVLNGVVSSSVEDQGTAIIEYRGKQQTYSIGEKIEGTNATLSQVQTDRVIIKNAGRHETLMLTGIDFSKPSSARRNTNVVTRTSNSRPATPKPRSLSSEAAEATNALRNKPSSFADFIAISPAMIDGNLVGYKVKPGKKADLFESIGLETGDVVTEINGLVLTDPSQAREAMGELRNAQSIQLTVNRDNDLISLFLELPEQ